MSESKRKMSSTAKKVRQLLPGGTVIPEFAMITNHGIQTFKDMKLQKYNEAENPYTIGNENSSMTIQTDTFKEITAPGRF